MLLNGPVRGTLAGWRNEKTGISRREGNAHSLMSGKYSPKEAEEGKDVHVCMF